jgi:hypothetical protein
MLAVQKTVPIRTIFFLVFAHKRGNAEHANRFLISFSRLFEGTLLVGVSGAWIRSARAPGSGAGLRSQVSIYTDYLLLLILNYY